MADITLVKETTSRGYKVFECWSFSKTHSDKCIGTHFITNGKGTYYRRIETRCFENAEQGNKLYKALFGYGYTRKKNN